MPMMVRQICKTPPKALYNIGVGHKQECDLLRRTYKDMLIYGCEPDLDMYHTILHRFPGELHNIAIDSSVGERVLYLNGNRGQTSFVRPPNDEIYNMQSIQCTTLDIFDTMCGMQDDILLWVDVEGWEYRVLQSGATLLQSGRVKWINIEEWNEGTKYYDPEVPKLLGEHGYERVIEYEEHPTHHDVIYKHHSIEVNPPIVHRRKAKR